MELEEKEKREYQGGEVLGRLAKPVEFVKGVGEPLRVMARPCYGQACALRELIPASQTGSESGEGEAKEEKQFSPSGTPFL